MSLDDTGLSASGYSLPESDLRTGPHPEQRPHHESLGISIDQHGHSTNTPPSHCGHSSQLGFTSQSQLTTDESLFAGLNYTSSLSHPMHSDFLPSMNHDNNFDGFSMSSLGDIANFDSLFLSAATCNDCTPVNATSIPHHHHKVGRLQGASAQLDGHFCCSWTVHEQPCLLCFSSAEALDNHIKSDHAGKDGTYRCLWQDCAKYDTETNTSTPVNFGNKPKLMRHVHSHTGFKPFPCPFPGCDKGFVTKEQLRNHETTHTKSRKFVCEQCGKAFAVKSALTTHITAVHEERKIHKCDLCGKAFADSSNLSKHKQTHYKSSGVHKRRTSRRDVSDGASTGTTPSISTPTPQSATPAINVLHSPRTSVSFSSFGEAFPPSKVSTISSMRTPYFQSHDTVTTSSGSFATISTASSPPPESFDPNCYCCDQNCPPPEYCCEKDCTAPDGPPTLCNPDVCDRSTFCDMPECLDTCNGSSSTTGCTSSISSPSLAATATDDQHSYLTPAQIQALRGYSQLPSSAWDAMLAPDMLTGNERANQQAMDSFLHNDFETQYTNIHS